MKYSLKTAPLISPGVKISSRAGPLLSLYICEVQSIFNYLTNPSGTIEIHDNASGCNTQPEIETACASTVDEIHVQDNISIYPNPANNILTISCKDGVTIEDVIIYNQTGQKVFEGKLSNNTINVSNLQKGMFIVELRTQEWKIRKKLIIQ